MRLYKFFFVLFGLLFFTETSMAFSLPFFKKKEEPPKNPPMVHTVDEWMESATNVKMDLRERPKVEQYEESEFVNIPQKPKYIVRYNVKAGSKELDLSHLYKDGVVRSYFISDSDFNNAAYTETYYYPQSSQTASTVYLIEMDKHLQKKERLSDLSIFEHTRYPLISTAVPYLRNDFFSTLTVVDFSSDSKKLLVKEKRGSHRYGLYETYVWIYYLKKEDPEDNECYRNNLAFSNEISNFIGLEGYHDKKDGQIPDLKYVDEGGYDINLNKLKNPPAKGLNGDYSKGAGGSYGQGEITRLPDWVRSGVVGNSSSEDAVKLSYKDINNYIKAVWKNEEMTSPTKTRWYNAEPVDFRANTYYPEKKAPGFGVRLNILNEMIKAYWFDRKDLILNYIRWDLNPLGFSEKNKDEIIVQAWAYLKDGSKASLGMWAVNVKDGLPRILDENEEIQIQANALYLQETLNPR